MLGRKFRNKITIMMLSCLVFVPLTCLAIATQPHKTCKKGVTRKIGAISIPFVENKGQIGNPKILFYTRGFHGYTLINEAGEIIYTVYGTRSGEKVKLVLKEALAKVKVRKICGKEKTKTRINYFKGKNPLNWRKEISTYYVVDLGEVYPAIALKLKARESSVEKIFCVKPGGDPSKIRLQISGGNGIKISEGGELIIESPAGSVTFSKPLAYQVINGKKTNIEVFYAISAQKNCYGFKVGNYDRSKPLFIDPLLASTYLGGNGDDFAYSIATDLEGNVYVAGSTSSVNFPVTVGVYDPDMNDQSEMDGFISKFNADLTQLLASTYLGGSNKDDILSLVIDDGGNVYVAGITSSTDFPVTSGAYDTTFNTDPNSSDCFVARLSSDLGDLMASTYLGGSRNDCPFPYPVSIAINPTSGDVYVAGTTESSDFPTTTGAYDNTFNGAYDAFVSRLDKDLKSLKSSTLLGGSKGDEPYAILIDGDFDRVYVAGKTESDDFPTSGSAYDNTFNGGTSDCFISCLDRDLRGLIASTYLGGYNYDYAYSAALGNGGLYVIGNGSYSFPTTPGAFSTENKGWTDGFVAKLDLSLERLLYSTFLGGSEDDYARTLAISKNGNIYVAGRTHSKDFPVTAGAFDTTMNNQTPLDYPDGFVAEFSGDLQRLLHSTFLGGRDFDYVRSIAITENTDIYLTGYTLSPSFPTTGACALNNIKADKYDAFVSLFSGNLNHNDIPLGEALDNDAFTWSTGGDAEWYGTREFSYFDCDVAKSGELDSNGISWLSTNVSGPGIISFYWKTIAWGSSLKFYLDNVFQASNYDDYDWDFKGVAIPDGIHEIKWIFSPSGLNSGQNAAYVDKFSFIRGPAIIIERPLEGEVAYHRYSLKIRWISTEAKESQVRIELLKNGIPIYLIAETTENDGEFDWPVTYPLPQGYGYQVRITFVDNPDLSAISQPFWIIYTETSSLGQFLVFNSAKDVVAAMDHEELDVGAEVGSSFTVEAWFLVNSWQYGTVEILGKGVDPFKPDYAIWLGPPDVAGFYVTFHNGKFSSILKYPIYPIGGWHHVALVVDGTLLRFFYDGSLEIEEEYSDLPILVSNGNFRLGVNLVKGGIDEVRISDVARYSEDFSPSTIPFTCDVHTLALWHFEEPLGATQFHDECGVDNVLFRIVPGDMDKDGDVDGKDLAAFAAAFGTSTGDENFNSACDLNEDGVIDEVDLESFAGGFGR